MKSQHDLPLNKDITARFVPKIVALMVYLGTLCFVFSLFMSHSSVSWEKELTTHLSIDIPTFDAVSSSTLQTKVLDLLEQAPEIQTAAVVPQKEMATLFHSLLGNDINIDLFALPVIIDVSLKKNATLDIQKLETSLKRISPHIHLTDHRSWQAQVLKLINSVVFVSFFVAVLIVCGALATTTFATKTSLLIHHQVIEVLSLIGATHSYIAKQFQIHALKQTFMTSVIGSSLAFLTFFGLITLLEKAEFPCVLSPSFFSQTLCIFAFAPFFTAFIVMLSVRISVMKALRR